MIVSWANLKKPAPPAMRIQKVQPTGVERFFGEDDIIVSKTDSRGIITYANDIFVEVSGYAEKELLGQPHNLIRHPEMPQCVFRILWQVVQSGKEIFAYVVNQCKNGDHYWVFAHVTPSFDDHGKVIGYHSNRRVPSRRAVEAVRPIYAALLGAERKAPNPDEGMRRATDLLMAQLAKAGVDYEQFVFSLVEEEAVCR